MTIGFPDFPKIPRLSRICTITEKIDGTNASVHVRIAGDLLTPFVQGVDTLADCCNGPELFVRAGSRTRWLAPYGGEDNFGFGQWVHEHACQLGLGLGVGHHYGEWWGRGIQRGYGSPIRRFSLFNTSRWERRGIAPLGLDADGNLVEVGAKEMCPLCCDVVPTLFRGPFSTRTVDIALETLKAIGSAASRGFMQPEGVIVYHHALAGYFKKTILKDEEHKGKSK